LHETIIFSGRRNEPLACLLPTGKLIDSVKRDSRHSSVLTLLSGLDGNVNAVTETQLHIVHSVERRYVEQSEIFL
jgi:hypothetical protein